MRNTLPLLFFTSALLGAGCDSKNCSKKTSCPAYEPGLLESWFPLPANGQLVYRNAAGATRTFHLGSPVESTPYEIRGVQNCFANRSIYTTDLNTYGVPVAQFAYDQSRSGNEGISEQAFDLRIDNSLATVSGIRDTGFRDAQVSGQVYSPTRYASLSFEGQSFSDVRGVLRDTSVNKATGFQRLYFSRTRGLIAYSFYPSDSLWVLQ